MKRSIVLFVSLIILFNQDAYTQSQRSVKSDTLISNYLSEINADSIRSTMQTLQDFGTRFMIAPNRRDIAVWLKNKFISVGYPNTVIDSFMVQKTWNSNTYDLFQYNVIATLQGGLNPELVYVMGAHYDSYAQTGDPMITAPGADDNASGTAAAIEVARVMKKNNYQPASTIQFVAFAAEEMMMSPGGCGSCYYTSQAVATGQKIQMMINNDMISHATTSGNWIVNLNRYDNSGWVSKLASYIIVNYTSLSIFMDGMNNWTDSRPFYDAGFYAVYFEEAQFSPYYHQTTDIITNYNMPYCAEITKIACGMLLQQSLHPGVMNLHAVQIGSDIKVTWNKSNESNVVGYNIYRSLNSPGSFTKLNSATINKNDTVYIDPSPIPLIDYFYAVVTVDAMLAEGEILQYDSAMVLTLNQGILVVDDSQLEYLNPTDSSVDNFYDSLLYAYHPHQFDVISSGGASLSEIGKYSTVVWHTDRYTSSSKFYLLQKEIERYLTSGGNMLFIAGRFCLTTEHNLVLAKKYLPGSFNYDILHCDSMYRSPTSFFYKALSLSAGYPSVEIDTLKTPVANNHHLGYIESIYKRSDANNIYSYDTQYDSTSAQGNMKGLPVGYEYLGNDYKLIVLSFPLWYMRFDDAKSFMDYAMEYVFNESVSAPELSSDIGNTVLFPCYPNPFSATTSVKYYLSGSDNVQLAIYDITGNLISDLVNRSQSSGVYTYLINSENLNNGIYFCTLKTSKCSQTTKLVLIK